MSRRQNGTLLAALLLLAGGLAGVAGGQTITETGLPVTSSRPQCITPGPDGNLWVAERNFSKIARVTTSGAITEFAASGVGGPTGTLRMQCITPGPDGSLWFTVTEGTNGQIGKITPTGAVTIFPTLMTSRLYSITAGPASDGALWFTEAGSNVSKIGRFTTAGVLTEFLTPTPNGFFNVESTIALGPDGNLWFTEFDANKIGRLDPTKINGCQTTPTVCITEFAIPTAGSAPAAITAGPDGALWFAEQTGNKIGRITTAGVVTGEFPLPTGTAGARDIVAGPDGALWFTEQTANKIGRITTGGAITEYSVPTASSEPEGIAKGPDGNIWFTEFAASKVGKISTGAAGGCSAGATTLCLNNSRFQVNVVWSVPSQGTSGVGAAVPLTPDTGYFWFFSSTNVELVIKALDGRGVNNKFWIFYGALSDVSYTITVRDTMTNAVKTYSNQQGNLASVADVAAFPGSIAPPSGEAALGDTEISGAEDPEATARAAVVAQASFLAETAKAFAHRATPTVASAVDACSTSSTALCLNQNRFSVRVSWSVPSQGTSGTGTAVALTSDTGYFWFFSSTNVELVIKVLDGRPVNNKFWVFYGALSDVQYTIMVTDTQTGAVKTYSNNQGNLASVADVAAF